ncbi:hypothetical protein [Psychrobacter aquaticus]|uniref:Uncharacterized protein n=1 Tax=Psychrobacter aquaticus CMS 56 TaxID=1354303 RepID=U4TF60_9GAMM|nr:hypothetical protein [Psychrobacter aquaticus]ERL57078.1 hypothetical protein M917_0023 [Psychrobacter aquaticus CMS 56]
MSANQNNNHDRQRHAKNAPYDSSTSNENSHSYQPRKLTSIAGYALLLSSASFVLVGCQSTSMPSSAAGSAIDFNIANTADSQAQGRAFNDSLTAIAKRHEQLFDQDKYPNTDNQAKSHLLAAIRQHLATEHVAVAQASYQAVPFIDADSIDAGSSSLLRTIIETYGYGLEHSDSEYDDSTSDESDDSESSYDESGYNSEGLSKSKYSEEERKAIAAMVKLHATDLIENMEEDEDLVFGEDGFNGYGYNKDGYHRQDYDSNTTEEYELAESAAVAAVLDEAGENEELAYNDYDEYEEEGSDNDNRGGILAGMSDLKLKNLAKNYEAMQMAKQQPKPLNEKNTPIAATGVIGQMLSMFHRTPEQIAATNAYQYQNLTFNSVSQYKPKQRQLQSVYSYDYMAPTISSSIQIPLAFDFNNSSITVDPSAIMPIVALAKPENTPLPNQMASHTVSFGLPESITTQLPSAVIYDAAIAAIQSSMAELAPEHFSAVDIRDDQFAKEVGANRAVKVYFGSQQSGEMIGKTLKYMTRSLQDYVDANPNKYPDGAMLKAALDKLALYNKGYQSADVGSLLQLIEAVGPISFNQTNYYYLDSSDRLLAKQQRMNIGGDLLGSTTTVLNQIRYDKASFNRHILTPLLAESFGADAKPAIDGNAWIATQRQQKDRLQTARYARYDYSYSSSEDDSDSRDDDSSREEYSDVYPNSDVKEDTDRRSEDK